MSYNTSSVTGASRSRTRPLPELPPIVAPAPEVPTTSAPPAEAPPAETPVVADAPAVAEAPAVVLAPVVAEDLTFTLAPMAADVSSIVLPSATGPLATLVPETPIAAAPVEPLPEPTTAEKAAAAIATQPSSALGAVTAGLALSVYNFFSRSR
jgi:hypothetical protein